MQWPERLLLSLHKTNLTSSEISVYFHRELELYGYIAHVGPMVDWR